MLKGSLNSPYIWWKQYEAPKFQPYLSNDNKWKTCGSATLSLVTGKSPSKIDKDLPKTQKHWSTLAFKKYLVKKGYTVIEVTKRNITNTNAYAFPLTSNHIIALNLEMDSDPNDGASWFLLHDNILYHNTEPEYNFNALYFLNKPPQNVLVIWHRKWQRVIKKVPAHSVYEQFSEYDYDTYSGDIHL